MLQDVEQRHFLWGSAHLKQDDGDVKLRVHCGLVFWAKCLKFKRDGGERGINRRDMEIGRERGYGGDGKRGERERTRERGRVKREGDRGKERRFCYYEPTRLFYHTGWTCIAAHRYPSLPIADNRSRPGSKHDAETASIEEVAVFYSCCFAVRRSFSLPIMS